MFSANDVQARLKGHPFTPVRVVTTTNQPYAVYHPDLVIVGRRFVMIDTPSSENATQAEQVSRIAPVQVTELRDLPLPASPSNGQTS